MKYHPHNGVHFLTFGIEEGLLLLCNPLCEAIIQSCLAGAQRRYPIRICHIIIEATHVHVIAVVESPTNLPDFIRHFKTESAHRLNRLLGRRKRTIWCEGYDSPIVLTPLRALLAIVYLYSNPAKDGLEDSIDAYPGFSSWEMYRSGIGRKVWKLLPRNIFRTLPGGLKHEKGYAAEAKRLKSLPSAQELEFILEPNAWLEAFGIHDPREQEQWNARLIARLRTVEERFRSKRARTGRKVVGRQVLIRQTFDLSYRPERKQGRRTFCLTEIRSLRVKFIEFFRDLVKQARAVTRKWKLGDFSTPYPLGLYPPSLPRLAEPLGIW